VYILSDMVYCKKEWKDCGTNADLKLPPKNEFIPSNFDLKARDEHVRLKFSKIV